MNSSTGLPIHQDVVGQTGAAGLAGAAVGDDGFDPGGFLLALDLHGIFPRFVFGAKKRAPAGIHA
jgi:hypothetical protein